MVAYPEFQLRFLFDKIPNEKYLENFQNLLQLYMPTQSGIILDVGCGQSEYILDLIHQPHKFFAIDIDNDQLAYLMLLFLTLLPKYNPTLPNGKAAL
jgi:SAM-dependent methyltransferase